jgi:hypothetical protein
VCSSDLRSQIGIKYESDNTFGESREIEQLLKHIDFINSLGEIKETVNEEEVQYFDQDFLIERWSGLSYEDIMANKKYKQTEKVESAPAEAPEGGAEEEAPSATPETEAPAEGGEETA